MFIILPKVLKHIVEYIAEYSVGSIRRQRNQHYKIYQEKIYYNQSCNNNINHIEMKQGSNL